MLSVSQRATPQTTAGRADSFARTLRAVGGDALAAFPRVPIIACGMVGAEHGWADAGYAELPIVASEHGRQLIPVPFGNHTVHIVPGMRTAGGDGHPYPDVIRGEETQLLGVLRTIGDPRYSGVVVLPGTHSKWVALRNGVVGDFATALTGELFSVLLRDTILGQPAEPAAGFRDEAFARGLAVTAPERSRAGIASAVFSARTLFLSGELAPADIPDYLSGILIGDEIRHMVRVFTPGDAGVCLCGGDGIVRRYAAGLRALGIPARVVGEDAAVAGLFQLAVDAGLVAATTGEPAHAVAGHPTESSRQEGALR